MPSHAASSWVWASQRATLLEQGRQRPSAVDPLDGLAQEGLDQDVPRPGLRDAARAQIEERRVVELAGGRAVAALDVVGVDLKLRLGVDLGAGRTGAGSWQS